MPKDELIERFFYAWHGENIRDEEITKTMKTKIKSTFGVDV
ncbi:hypothetical protein [Salibacterium aidingense]|nr:hypothetical protein [Salibacterium aidingense]